jgi:hypothetical protein
MGETDDEEQRIIRDLASGDELRFWEDSSFAPSVADIIDAGNDALGIGIPEPFRELERDRAQRRVVLLQIAARHVRDATETWETIFSHLSRDELELVETLLGDETLAELIGRTPKRWLPGTP